MKMVTARFFIRFIFFLKRSLPNFDATGLWKFVTVLTRVEGAEFTRSVYGPYLVTDWDDGEFHRSVTGRGGFKLHDLLRAKRGADFIFVDIGAAIGLHALLAQRNPRYLKGYAIETNPTRFAQLQRNIERNRADGISALRVASHDRAVLDDIHETHPDSPVFLKIGAAAPGPEIVRQLAGSNLRQDVDELYLEVDPDRFPAEEIEGLFRAMREMGLKEKWRSRGSGQYAVHFQRPAVYGMVERERLRLGCWEQGAPDAPRYSVCVCNYNMEDTLERAMTSVIEQLDERYEVLVIDDGSSDGSVEVLRELARRYANFRFITLPRDRHRLLGETRNISIRAARGEYVLLHIDADDVWEPYLQDFVTLFHKIEAADNGDFYLSGQQTGIAKRALMLSVGPYENIYRCEDRNMMMKLAKRDALRFLDYKVYRTRLSQPPGKKLVKIVRDACSQMTFDLRQAAPRRRYIFRALMGPIIGSQFSRKLTLFRALAVIPVYIASRFREKIITEMSWAEFISHHERTRGTYAEIMTRLGADPDFSFLSGEAQKLFSYDVKLPGFRGSS